MSAGPTRTPALNVTAALFHIDSRPIHLASFELFDLDALTICSRLLWSVTKVTCSANTSRCLNTTSRKWMIANNSRSELPHLRAGVGNDDDAYDTGRSDPSACSCATTAPTECDELSVIKIKLRVWSGMAKNESDNSAVFNARSAAV